MTSAHDRKKIPWAWDDSPRKHMLIVLGQFDFSSDEMAPAAALMRAMTEATVREPGCIHYAFAADLCLPNRFQLSELWQDEASLKAHSETPHMAVFRAGLAKLRVQHRAVKRYEVKEAGEL